MKNCMERRKNEREKKHITLFDDGRFHPGPTSIKGGPTHRIGPFPSRMSPLSRWAHFHQGGALTPSASSPPPTAPTPCVSGLLFESKSRKAAVSRASVGVHRPVAGRDAVGGGCLGEMGHQETPWKDKLGDIAVVTLMRTCAFSPNVHWLHSPATKADRRFGDSNGVFVSVLAKNQWPTTQGAPIHLD